MSASDVARPSASPEIEHSVESSRGATARLRSTAAWFRRRGPVGRGALALLVFTVASIFVFALPVMADLRHRCVASCVADTHLYVWSFEWMRYAVAHTSDPFFTS